MNWRLLGSVIVPILVLTIMTPFIAIGFVLGLPWYGFLAGLSLAESWIEKQPEFLKEARGKKNKDKE